MSIHLKRFHVFVTETQDFSFVLGGEHKNRKTSGFRHPRSSIYITFFLSLDCKMIILYDNGHLQN